MLESEFKLRAIELEKELEKIKDYNFLESTDPVEVLTILAVLISELEKKRIFTILKNLSKRFIHINIYYEIYVINHMDNLFEKANKKFMNCDDPKKAEELFKSGIKDISNIIWGMKHYPIFSNN
ncbi:MAG: hypothetical protein PHH12_00210 [Candidatus Shapirobacteria bacterium]|jgi:hypothetical protein|nr:hypothetical protein [Candidatus Shapirobacteria bacterium]